jgi:hypothetical protein
LLGAEGRRDRHDEGECEQKLAGTHGSILVCRGFSFFRSCRQVYMFACQKF